MTNPAIPCGASGSPFAKTPHRSAADIMIQVTAAAPSPAGTTAASVGIGRPPTSGIHRGTTSPQGRTSPRVSDDVRGDVPSRRAVDLGKISAEPHRHADPEREPPEPGRQRDQRNDVCDSVHPARNRRGGDGRVSGGGGHDVLLGELPTDAATRSPPPPRP
jgi:hypothetical protein